MLLEISSAYLDQLFRFTSGYGLALTEYTLVLDEVSQAGCHRQFKQALELSLIEEPLLVSIVPGGE